MKAIGLGSLAVTAGLLLFDYLKDMKRKKEKEKATIRIKKSEKFVKICLTGGPCGGKSSGINCIYNTFKQISAPFFVVPEAATIIGTSGLSLDLSTFSKRGIQQFQICLMKLQYNLEECVMSIAESMGTDQKIPVILCDRGLLDGKAYAGPENFAKILRIVSITEAEILERYQAVIHMVTAARGAPKFYMGNNVRKEDINFAIELDGKIRESYKRHPKRYIISNDFFVKSFQHKEVILLAQVFQILQMIINQNDVVEYYHPYNFTNKRKSSEQPGSNQATPYVIRKKKLQKFLHKNRNINLEASQIEDEAN